MAELEHKPWCSDSESGSLLTLSCCLLYPLFSLLFCVSPTFGLDFLRSLFDNISLPWLCISQGSFHFKWQKTYSKKMYWFVYREEWGVTGDRQCRVWGLTNIIKSFFLLPVSHPASFWSLASSTSCRCFLFVVASMAGHSISVCRHHVLLKSKERVVLSICLYEISSIKVMCLFMGPITGQREGYCDWSGQHHVSIQSTRSWGFVSGSSFESVD